MNALLFCWNCIMTTLQGVIGFIFIALFFWGMMKAFKPSQRPSHLPPYRQKKPGVPER